MNQKFSFECESNMQSIVAEYDTEEIEVFMFFSMIYNIKNVLNFCIRVGLRTVLFWVITQRGVVISYRRFGTTYRYLQGHNNPEEHSSHLLSGRRILDP